MVKEINKSVTISQYHIIAKYLQLFQRVYTTFKPTNTTRNFGSILDKHFLVLSPCFTGLLQSNIIWLYNILCHRSRESVQSDRLHSTVKQKPYIRKRNVRHAYQISEDVTKHPLLKPVYTVIPQRLTCSECWSE